MGAAAGGGGRETRPTTPPRAAPSTPASAGRRRQRARPRGRPTTTPTAAPTPAASASRRGACSFGLPLLHELNDAVRRLFDRELRDVDDGAAETALDGRRVLKFVVD